MSGEWMNHCYGQWEKTAGSFSRGGAAVGAALGGAAGHALASSAPGKPHLAAKGIATGAGALMGGLYGGVGVGGLQDADRSLKQRQSREIREKFEPQIRSARWKWEDRQMNQISQKRHGVDHWDSPLDREGHNSQILDPVMAKGDKHHAKVKHLPHSEQLKYWRGLNKTAGQLLKSLAKPVLGGMKAVGGRVIEKPISTTMGAVGAYGTAKGALGTYRAAKGDIQSAQNAHGTPTQAQYMGARQARPNPARMSQTGSY